MVSQSNSRNELLMSGMSFLADSDNDRGAALPAPRHTRLGRGTRHLASSRRARGALMLTLSIIVPRRETWAHSWLEAYTHRRYSEAVMHIIAHRRPSTRRRFL